MIDYPHFNAYSMRRFERMKSTVLFVVVGIVVGVVALVCNFF